jgi:hypothetical protein
MKKIIYWLLTSLQAFLFVGIFVLDNLSHHHMTMYRTILLDNRTWKKDYPLDGILLIIRVILVLISAAALIEIAGWIKKRKLVGLRRYLEAFILVVISGGSAAFIALGSPDSLPVFYYAVFALVAITVFQVIKELFLANSKS